MIRRKDIIEGLRNRGYEVEAHISVKNGVELKGIRFINETGICPIVYTDQIIKEEDTLYEAISIVLDTYHNASVVEFDREKLMDPKFILENLYVGLQKESQENIVKSETNFEGIEKYLYVRINNDSSFKLTISLLETVQIDKVIAWKQAENNTFTKTQIVSMTEMLSEMTGQKIEEVDGVPIQFIVGNSMNYRGASAILDIESLKKFAVTIDKYKFFVLPSSIHEMIIIPDDGKYSIEELNAMVAEVNQKQVDPEERLTNRAYVIEV